MSTELDSERLSWFLEHNAQWVPHHASVWAGGVLLWGPGPDRQRLQATDPRAAIDLARQGKAIKVRVNPKHNLQDYSNPHCAEYHDYLYWIAAHDDFRHLITPERAYLAGRHDERVAMRSVMGPIAAARAPDQAVWIDYTNWQHERAVRQVIPRSLYWGRTQYHPEEQWLLRAHDVAKDAVRDFSFTDIHRISYEAIAPAT